MNFKIKLLVFGLLFLMVCTLSFSQKGGNGLVGLVDLYDNQLFVNIAKGCFVADNETYFPCLFTIEIPNSVENYWWSLGRSSEFIFKFLGGQFIFILDDVRNDGYYADIPLYAYNQKELHEVSKDSADNILHIWRNFFSDNDNLKKLEFEANSNTDSGLFFVASYYNVFFLFYNITDVDISKIISSFTIIRPHFRLMSESSDQ